MSYKPKPIADIKQLLSEVSISDVCNVLAQFKDDERVGVKSLIKQYEKKLAAHETELKRLQYISQYEREYTFRGLNFIAGVDEVGRGPLAGPVVAAAVILPRDCVITYVNDSKKLSASMREKLNIEIKEKAVELSIGIVDNVKIDEINILQATLQAMSQAVNSLKNKPDVLLIDALRLPNVNIKQESILKGDEKSISIAAASICAKVFRDNLMIELDSIYPQYNFSKNKGYGTAEHMRAIEKYGPCPIHRRSFL